MKIPQQYSKKEYITKDDIRFKLAKNKLDQDKKLRKQQAEEAKEN